MKHQINSFESFFFKGLALAIEKVAISQMTSQSKIIFIVFCFQHNRFAPRE